MDGASKICAEEQHDQQLATEHTKQQTKQLNGTRNARQGMTARIVVQYPHNNRLIPQPSTPPSAQPTTQCVS